MGAQVRLVADERPLEGFLLVHLEEGEAPHADGVPDSSLLDSAVIFARIAPSFIPMNGTIDLPLSMRLTSVGTYRHVPMPTKIHAPALIPALAISPARISTSSRSYSRAVTNFLPALPLHSARCVVVSLLGAHSAPAGSLRCAVSNSSDQ